VALGSTVAQLAINICWRGKSAFPMGDMTVQQLQKFEESMTALIQIYEK
jgi:hypothetical protein